jgi:thiol-disulfide isomerase/thioredoxin
VVGPSLTGVVVVVGVLALATAFGWWRHRRDGRLLAVTDDLPAKPVSRTGGGLVWLERSPALTALGVRPGAVNLVQFSSAVCAPCRAARRVLEEVEGAVDGVHLVEVNVERHLDAVREFGVWRTPTVLVVDGAGRVVRRASGVPTREELIAAVTPLLTGAGR